MSSWIQIVPFRRAAAARAFKSGFSTSKMLTFGGGPSAVLVAELLLLVFGVPGHVLELCPAQLAGTVDEIFSNWMDTWPSSARSGSENWMTTRANTATTVARTSKIRTQLTQAVPTA